MSTIEERTAYLDNPFFKGHIFGNFSPFYATIAVCTALGVFLIALNVICGCCSKYRNYWQDRHTGNRWLVSIWSATPHKQPPLDFTELKDVKSFYPANPEIEHPAEYSVTHHRPQQNPFPQHHQPPQSRAYTEEYVQLHTKRESDI
uniref:Putative conserved plasma membrane protein n=1 Tax=Corethrella appendiculata TaxID=1370023 RepID=U5ELL6_9DIPT